SLVAVERDRVEAALGQPEIPAEGGSERACPSLELPGQRLVAPDLAREMGGADLGVVGVALDLGGRDRPTGQAAVGELDRVPAVLPALVDQAARRVPPLVLDVAV